MARHNVKAGTAGFVATSFNGSEDHVNFSRVRFKPRPRLPDSGSWISVCLGGPLVS